jgi:hypothetical protein
MHGLHDPAGGAGFPGPQGREDRTVPCFGFSSIIEVAKSGPNKPAKSSVNSGEENQPQHGKLR